MIIRTVLAQTGLNAGRLEKYHHFGESREKTAEVTENWRTKNWHLGLHKRARYNGD